MSKIEQIAIIGTQRKKKIAKKLEKDLKKWNNLILQAVKKNYPIFELSNRLKKKLHDVLDRHYQRVFRWFSNTKLFKSNAADFERDLSKRIEDFLHDTGLEHEDFIINNTNDLIQISIKKAQKISEEEGITDQKELLLLMLLFLKRKLSAKTVVIGITETNWSAEAVKALQTKTVKNEILKIIEEIKTFIAVGGNEIAMHKAKYAKDISNYSNSNIVKKVSNIAIESVNIVQTNPKKSALLLSNATLLLTNVKKTWLTMGDNRVRKIHKVANGQTVLDTLPFKVDKELLMYPGDGSLGASLKNLIGCRCWAAYL